MTSSTGALERRLLRMTDSWHWDAGTSWGVWHQGEIVRTGLTLEQGRRLVGPSILVPDRYLQSTTTAEQAQATAESYLAELARERQQKSGVGLTFEPVQLARSHPLWFTFWRECPQWQEEGMVPGALMCSVDRCDLHVWTEEETDAYWRHTGVSDS